MKRKFDYARRCKQPSATIARLRELSSSSREVKKHPQEVHDSLLSHVEITGDFNFKGRNDGYHPLDLACEIDSRVAARTYLEQKKQRSTASKVQLKRNMPKVNAADTNSVHCCS